jgi:hypothetical protein
MVLYRSCPYYRYFRDFSCLHLQGKVTTQWPCQYVERRSTVWVSQAETIGQSCHFENGDNKDLWNVSSSAYIYTVISPRIYPQYSLLIYPLVCRVYKFSSNSMDVCTPLRQYDSMLIWKYSQQADKCQKYENQRNSKEDTVINKHATVVRCTN